MVNSRYALPNQIYDINGNISIINGNNILRFEKRYKYIGIDSRIVIGYDCMIDYSYKGHTVNSFVYLSLQEYEKVNNLLTFAGFLTFGKETDCIVSHYMYIED